MSNLTQAARNKLPLTDFGDPANRKYPVVDQDDLDKAAKLIGKAKNPKAVKKRLISIAKKKNLKLPDAWAEVAKMSADEPDEGIHLECEVLFSGETETAVIRSGKAFQLGDYPDKQFSMNEEEADDKIAKFSPVPLDLEHLPHKFAKPVKTILDGKLGTLKSLTRVDNEVFCEMEIPKWLNEVHGEDNPLSVSLAFDPFSKEIIGCALVLNPRVADAQTLATAFSAFEEEKSNSAPLRKKTLTMNATAFMESIKELFARFSGEDQPAKPPVTEALPEPAKPAAFAGETRKEKEQAAIIANFSKTVESQNDHLLALEAERFYDGLFRAGKADPAEKDSIIAIFKSDAKDDNSGSVALFSADGKINEGDRLKNFKTLMSKRVANPRYEELLKNATVMSSGAETAPIDGNRKAQLLAMTGIDFKKEAK